MQSLSGILDYRFGFRGGLDDSLSLVLLKQIAAECMVAGGPSVNLARALLATTGEWIYHDPVCISNAREAFVEGSHETEMELARLWPNPAHRTLNYEIPCVTDGDAGFQIWDVAGRMVTQGSTSCGSGSLDLPEMASGMHLVEIRLADGKAWRWLVVISK